MSEDTKIAWKPGARFSDVNVYAVAQELDRIREDKGVLTAETVVEAARNKKSILHSFFEWNDTVAAQKYREEQARLVIRSIEITTETIRIGPAFVAIEKNGEKMRDYIPSSTLRVLDAERLKVLSDVRKQLDGMYRRYSYLTELSTVWEAIAAETM